MTDRVTVSDLTWAAEWIASFDPEDPNDPRSEAEQKERRDAVVAWVNAEIKRREERSLEVRILRELARRNNTTTQAIRNLPNFKATMARAIAAAREPQD